MSNAANGLLSLNAAEARIAAAVFDRLFPPDAHGPGAVEIGVLAYVDRALAGEYAHLAETYRLGLAALDHAERVRSGRGFAEADPDAQDALLRELEAGAVPGMLVPDQTTFFGLLRAHLQEGLFADPAYGGNRGKAGWRFLGHPGFWLENTAEENLAREPATKGGRTKCLADLDVSDQHRARHDTDAAARDDGEPQRSHEIPGYDPQRGARPPDGPADVVLVGVGAAGSLAARVFAAAGLRVVGLEVGPYRTSRDFVPDELGSAYYCRGRMGAKYLSETPTWRTHEDDAGREAVYTLGRMMNGVGGSVIHWGGAVRRALPHHFRYRSHIRETGADAALPEGHTVVDWPIGYDDLEPYYERLEHEIGVAGDAAANPFVPIRRPYPLPPVRPFTMGESFRRAASALGLHPYPTPVAVYSQPYNGRPATSYCAWSGGFGPFRDDRWYPGHNWLPDALATGNFDLRTHCRVVRILTDTAGQARGVEYVDARGVRRIQEARTVILASYTFENIRLLLLSGDARHRAGLGNDTRQVGRHWMTKMWSDVSGHVPDVVFNAHTGPAAQMWSLDDFEAPEFDSAAHGFIGGGTPNVENQRLPIQISREPLPPDVARWGRGYRDHLREWQHIAAVRLQPDALPYESHFVDLDPHHRDRSGLGLPVVRITYDLKPNEHRASAFLEDRATEILREMGARRTWPGVRVGGVVSSHDLGGARMGDDPATSVVDADLRVHDTPNLYVYGTAVFPTCHGVNPTHTMWAICYRAAERLVERLRAGEE